MSQGRSSWSILYYTNKFHSIKGNLGYFRKKSYFVNNHLIRVQILKILLLICDTYYYDYLPKIPTCNTLTWPSFARKKVWAIMTSDHVLYFHSLTVLNFKFKTVRLSDDEPDPTSSIITNTSPACPIIWSSHLLLQRVLLVWRTYAMRIWAELVDYLGKGQNNSRQIAWYMIDMYE